MSSMQPTQLSLPGTTSETTLMEYYGLAPVKFHNRATFMDFFCSHKRPGDWSSECLDNRISQILRSTLFSADARIMSVVISEFPVNVVRMGSLVWCRTATMPESNGPFSQNNKHLAQEVYCLSLGLYERIRRRNISISLNKNQRYRILKKWLARYMEITQDATFPRNFEELMCRFAIACLSLNLSIMDVLYQIDKNRIAAGDHQKDEGDDFVDYVCEEVTMYMPNFTNGYIGTTIMLSMLLESIT